MSSVKTSYSVNINNIEHCVDIHWDYMVPDEKKKELLKFRVALVNKSTGQVVYKDFLATDVKHLENILERNNMLLCNFYYVWRLI